MPQRPFFAVLLLTSAACFSLALAPAVLAIEEGGTGAEAPAEDGGGGGGDEPTSGGAEAIHLVNPIGTKSVPEAIGRIVDTMLGLLGSGAFLMFVYGGFTWLISGGSADRIKRGKKTIVWASLGLILVFASAGLVRFVLWLVRAGS